MDKHDPTTEAHAIKLHTQEMDRLMESVRTLSQLLAAATVVCSKEVGTKLTTVNESLLRLTSMVLVEKIDSGQILTQSRKVVGDLTTAIGAVRTDLGFE